MQFVQSVPVAEVLATEGNIQVSVARMTTRHAVTRGIASLTALYFIVTELLQEARAQ